MSDIKRMCVGFAFDKETHDRVLMIRKNRPEWQKGKLNGVGGHIEDGEKEHDAMAREFMEETGLSVPAENWQLFVTMAGKGWVLYTFCAEISYKNMLGARTTTDEGVDVWLLESLLLGGTARECVPNSAWLLPMARDFLTNKYGPMYARVYYG